MCKTIQQIVNEQRAQSPLQDLDNKTITRKINGSSIYIGMSEEDLKKRNSKLSISHRNNRATEASILASIKARSIKVAVKALDEDWITYDSISIAGKAIGNNTIVAAPKRYFPIDGSIFIAKLGKFKGWQFKRIVEK